MDVQSSGFNNIFQSKVQIVRMEMGNSYLKQKDIVDYLKLKQKDTVICWKYLIIYPNWVCTKNRLNSSSKHFHWVYEFVHVPEVHLWAQTLTLKKKAQFKVSAVISRFTVRTQIKFFIPKLTHSYLYRPFLGNLCEVMLGKEEPDQKCSQKVGSSSPRCSAQEMKQPIKMSLIKQQSMRLHQYFFY